MKIERTRINNGPNGRQTSKTLVHRPFDAAYGVTSDFPELRVFTIETAVEDPDHTDIRYRFRVSLKPEDCAKIAPKMMEFAQTKGIPLPEVAPPNSSIPHLLEGDLDWRVAEFQDIDKRIEIVSQRVGGPLAFVDNDDVPNIGVSAQGFGHDVASLMAAAPALRNMVRKLLAENPASASSKEAKALIDRITFPVVLPEDYEPDTE